MKLAASALVSPPIVSQSWEQMWSPYAEELYTAVLDQITSTDIILDIGAGDLRLARRMAQKAQKVYAIEQHGALIRGTFLPNLNVFVDDARQRPFPPDINTAVLLMRHCTHFGLFWNKLTAVGCQHLITNARWGVGIETIDLTTSRIAFKTLNMGWYGCPNGHVGFKVGPPEHLSTKMLASVAEVSFCPAC